MHVTVAHYPPGASKWNPIEHRLFSEISKNWAGRPLDSYETVLNFIRTTKTKTGLKVNARLVNKQYAKGIKISDPAMTVLNFKRPTSLPKWNYTLRPSKGCVPRSVEKERRPPLRHQSIRSGGNLRVFENLAQTLVAVDAS